MGAGVVAVVGTGVVVVVVGASVVVVVVGVVVLVVGGVWVNVGKLRSPLQFRVRTSEESSTTNYCNETKFHSTSVK